ncbi:MAG: TldD/PmbA family protein, partial [Candidatus Methanomethyliaceae archaeon]|nr:TldD/PmbA family protein [Candidatus Methanomethyliaceae archaeon]
MSLLEICERGIKKAINFGSDETEIYVESLKNIEVVIEKNDIQFGKSQIETAIGIRAFKNKGLGFASVSDFMSLEDGIKRAIELASASPPDKYNKLPTPVKLKEIPNLYDHQSKEFSVQQALEYAISMLNNAKNYDHRISVESGKFNAQISTRAIMNSNGIVGEETSSFFTYQIMGMAIDDNGAVSSLEYEFDGVRFISDIDTTKCALEFARKAINSLGARKSNNFKGKVLFSPTAVLELITLPIIYSINANNVQKGTSRWRDKINTPIASPLLTIEDNGILIGGLGSSSFDREGLPHSPITIIENGVLLSYLYNTYT